MELSYTMLSSQTNIKFGGENVKLSQDILQTLDDFDGEIYKLQETLNCIRAGLGLKDEEIEIQVSLAQDQMDITICDKSPSGSERYPVGTFDINAEDISDLEQAIWEETSQVLYYAVIRLPEEMQG